MKRIILASAMALAIVGSAFAQSVNVTLEESQRDKIKTYVVQNKIQPVVLQERVVVGATLPASLELAAVPADWGPQLNTYRYVYSDNRIAFVEPSSRRVVHVID